MTRGARVVSGLGQEFLSPGGPTRRLTGQLGRFAAIGATSTVAYGALFVLLRAVIPAQPANLPALGLTAVANTAANRRLTFGISGRDGAARHQAQGLLVFAIGLGLTSGALALLHAVATGPDRVLELSVLVVANLAATLVRFLLMRTWMFRAR